MERARRELRHAIVPHKSATLYLAGTRSHLPPSTFPLECLALSGATGRIGSRVLEYALAEGQSVRALVRGPASLEKRPGLDIMKGDVLDIPSVARTIRGTGAVISTLGGRRLEDSGEAQSRGMKNCVTAMTKLGVRRVLAVGGSGILDSGAGGQRHGQSNFLPVFRPVSMRYQQAWDAMRGSDSEWRMIACPDIVPGERTGTNRVVEDRLPEEGKQISVEDVADGLLKELREGKYFTKRVGVAYYVSTPRRAADSVRDARDGAGPC